MGLTQHSGMLAACPESHRTPGRRRATCPSFKSTSSGSGTSTTWYESACVAQTARDLRGFADALARCAGIDLSLPSLLAPPVVTDSSEEMTTERGRLRHKAALVLWSISIVRSTKCGRDVRNVDAAREARCRTPPGSLVESERHRSLRSWARDARYRSISAVADREEPSEKNYWANSSISFVSTSRDKPHRGSPRR
ncbi:hypothetical protein VTI74DRAFT_3669 [Chaetomium olivicolor]